MKYFKSAKIRITLWYAFVLTVILCAFAFFMYSEFARALYHDAEKKLLHETQDLNRSLNLFLGKHLHDKYLNLMEGLTPNSREYPIELKEKLFSLLQRWEKETQRLGRSTLILRLIGFDQTIFTDNLKGWEAEIIYPPFERDSAFMELGSSFQTIHFQKNPIRLHYSLYRFKTRPLLIIQTGVSTAELEQALRRLVLIIVFWIPGAVAAACVAGWFLARRAFHPVDYMIYEAKKITAAYLKSRLPRTFAEDELDRLAATLNAMMDRIESSTTLIRDFSSDISHELKTPLAIIRGEIELALRRSRSPEELKQTLRVIEGEVNDLIQLVDDLLLLVRSDANQLRIEKKIVSLEEMIQQVSERFQERMKAKSISFRLIASRDSSMMGDARYLKRLFSNLLDNAVKFTPDRGNVVVSVDKRKNRVFVEVVDNGVGIAKEMQEKVFLRFFRTDQARSQEGSGLGLNIAKAICEAHEGQLSIQSELSQGTTILLSFPAHH